ncbi:MAG: 4-hydroxybenzoyl-CoA thioesterase [Planctomycetota bacterium]|jgi:4-hydroxybenzoyl-CoA thioesterase
MKIFKSTYVVEWAHCDIAGIVFYPHFYAWFDQSTERMFKAMGFPYTSLMEKFGLVGAPLLETGSKYKNACKLGDELNMETWVAEHDEKTFLVKHVLHHADGRLALEGFEHRIMVARDSTSKKGMKATAIPEAIVLQFEAE